METINMKIETIPAVLYGKPSDNVYLFVHGKNGCKEEAARFAPTAEARGWQMLGIDLPGHGERKAEEEHFLPWYTVPELKTVIQYIGQHWKKTALIANSLGAWFSLMSFRDIPFNKCLFISPVLDMERLIRNMMMWASVSEDELRERQTIPTNFGETLSWEYLEYAKNHPVTNWGVPTEILYAGKDNLTGRDTVDAFTEKFGAGLTVMEDGEHWFHTPEQLDVLAGWADKMI